MVSSTTTALATRVDNDLAHRYDEAAAEEGVTAANILEQAAIYYERKNPDSIEAFDEPDPLENLTTLSESWVR